MKALKIITGLTTGLSLLMLTACTLNPVATYKETKQNADQVQAQITALDNKGYRADTPSMRYTSTTALLPAARWLSQPDWMNHRISMHGQAMPFNFWNNKILGPTGAAVSYQDGMNQTISLPFDYTGTIQGALDKLAQTTNYGYTVDGNSVTWFEFVTKTFDVSFMPGAAQYTMGGQTNIGSMNNGSSVSAGSGGNAGTTATNVSGQMQSGQSSSFQGNLSVWSDLEKTIKTMLSKDGQVIVSQATTTITVRDKPENVRLIGDYLASMNKDLSRQVALQVQVLQIKLNKAFSYGVNWNLVSGQLNINGGLADASQTALGNDLTSLGGVTATGLGYGIVHSATGDTSKILINALSQQGDVSTVTNPRVVTLNNQVAQIAITTQKTYLASSSISTSGQAGTSQVSLTPGTVTTGFTLYVLPKIINRNVFLQLTSELSSLDSIQTVSSTVQSETSSNSSSSSTTPNSAKIEEPTVSSKSFNQRVMVPSNCTLVLSGFRQVNNENIKSAPFGFQPAGSIGAQQDNTEVLVLITPIIVGDND
jgi:type IVB pilus formation R64 PilN family outer membrane protein